MSGGSRRSPRAGTERSPPRSSRAQSRAAAAPIFSPKCSQQLRPSPSQLVPAYLRGRSWEWGRQRWGTQEGPPHVHSHSCQGAKGGRGCRGHTHCFWPGDRGAQPGWQSRGGGRRWQYHRGGHGEGLGGGTHSHGGKRHNSLHPPPSFRRRLGPNPALRPCHSTPISGCRRPQPSQRKHSGEEGGAMGRRGPIHRPPRSLPQLDGADMGWGTPGSPLSPHRRWASPLNCLPFPRAGTPQNPN